MSRALLLAAMLLGVASTADAFGRGGGGKTTVYTIKSGKCGECAIKTMLLKFAGGKAGTKGTCKSVGYTTKVGETSQNVPMQGKVTCPSYTKPAAGGATPATPATPTAPTAPSTPSTPAGCVNMPYRDTYGTCATYQSKAWCVHGAKGAFWLPAWGALTPGAVKACCACGGGSSSAPHVPKHNVTSANVKSIVGTAVSTKGFSTLVAALKAGGLVTALSGAGPFTVFAPTDAAFAALPAGMLQALLLPANKATLVKILEYHVAKGAAYSKSLHNGESVPTLEGHPLTVTIANGKVGLDLAEKVNTWCAPGDGMLQSSAACQAAAQANGIPFAGAAGSEWHAGCIINDGKAYYSPLVHGAAHDTAVNGGYFCNKGNVFVTTADVKCTNGVIHVINHVLVPSDVTLPTPSSRRI